MSDPFVEIMDPLRVLRERIEAAFTECGLQPMHVGIVPGTSADGPHEVHMLAVLANDPPSAEDEEFNRLLETTRDAELERRSQEAHDELKRQMKHNGGFLDEQ